MPKKVTRRGGSCSTMSTRKEEPRTSQLAREQKSLESMKTHRLDPEGRNGGTAKRQREAGRKAAGKVAEAPTKPQGTVKDDEP